MVIKLPNIDSNEAYILGTRFNFHGTFFYTLDGDICNIFSQLYQRGSNNHVLFVTARNEQSGINSMYCIGITEGRAFPKLADQTTGKFYIEFTYTVYEKEEIIEFLKSFQREQQSENLTIYFNHEGVFQVFNALSSSS